MSKVHPRDLALALKSLAEVVQRLSPEELVDLLRGDTSIGKPVSSLSKRASSNTELQDSDELRSFADNLAKLNSREAGQEMLDRANFSRRQLEAIARIMKLSIRKDDTVARLTDRIVNTAIGARLNSKAIRGD